MSGNQSLHAASRAKNDEFYTELSDIEKELRHYKKHFQGKTVYCNCDDPRVSNFFHYFSYNFEHLGLKKLIATCYKSQHADLFSQNDEEPYVAGDFAYLMRYFHNLQADEQQQILDYELMVYVCEGSDSEKLKWFETINIAGEKLTAQELRNAVYAGSWLADAKRYFSKTGCAAHQIGQDYISGSPIRQEFLETALDWISDGHIEVYMAKHQNHPNALALWQYFQAVMTWVEATFPNKRTKFMKGQDWGRLYNRFKDEVLDSKRLEAEIAVLMQDDEVENKKGIYPYVLTRDEKYLNLRTFSDGMKQKLYEHQGGICPMCKETFLIEQMEGDHIMPWSQGGKTTLENGQMLCKSCNRRKSSR